MKNLIVSYTYYTEGGTRLYGMDIISGENFEVGVHTHGEIAWKHIRENISSEGVLLGVWDAGRLEVGAE